MIESHRQRLRALSDEALARVAELMDIPPADFVIDALDARGLCQADVVMALLRAGCSDYVAELARVTVKHFARPWPRPMPQPAAKLPPDQRWVAWHARDLALGACRPGIALWDREEPAQVRIACGMTVDEMVAAGVTRAQITSAVRGGHLRMSGEPR
jgi:hypothetical protein